MTPQEYEAMKDQIKAEIMQELSKDKPSERSQQALVPTRRKYINNKSAGRHMRGYSEEAPMRTLFNGVRASQVWDLVRRLTCWIMEQSYVSELKEEGLANEIASQLCETIIDCRKKYLDHNKEPKGEE